MKAVAVFTAAALLLGAAASAITIGAGPAIGTDKRGTTWYQEFQDWTPSDHRALDTDGDEYAFADGKDSARDLVAFYSHDDGTTVYFRADFFDIGYNDWAADVDLYVAIDCAAGGQEWLPDFTDTKTDHPWDVCIGVYNGSAASVYDDGWTNHGGTEFAGSYWHGDLDSVEFGVKRSFLLSQGWDGSSAMYVQPFTCRDGTDGGAGEINSQASDLVDAFGLIERGSASSNGWIKGAIASTDTSGRAKYAAIAHANQSLAPKSGTQAHIYTARADLDLYPGFIRMLDSAEMLDVPVNLHISGTLLMSFLWATQDPAEAGSQPYPTRDGPTFLRRVGAFVTNGPGSLVGGVLAEHILPYFEGDVNRKSIEQNDALLQSLFNLSGTNLLVLHTPERVIRTDTNNPHVSAQGPLDGRTFEDLTNSGYRATYLDEVTHLHWWFYPGETNNAGWDTNSWGRWAGGDGNDEEPYHHKVHRINGVYCFMINDREDQAKFGNDDGGMKADTRHTLLQKALAADYAQLTLVFDDWEAFAGNSFASSTPNNNADQWHRTLRWAANHPWIEMVNLRQVLQWALGDANWVVDHGAVYDKGNQTYEWLKRASEHDYDRWYYGWSNASAQLMEESFYGRVPNVHDSWAPGDMKIYGDLNHTGTLIRDSWDAIQQTAATNLRALAEWSYSAMIYETAWHDENAPSNWPPAATPWLAWPDSYKSRNYQTTFNRPEALAYEDDLPADSNSTWAIRLHGHVRDMGVLKEASDWAGRVQAGTQGEATSVYAKDIDDDRLDEYVLCNNRVFLCFERWGARLIKAFVYSGAGDALEGVGAPAANPPEESENEGVDNNRCSAFKDRYCTGRTNLYIDLDFAYPTAPAAGADSWQFVSGDGLVRKTFTLPAGRDAATASYQFGGGVGTMYTRFGLGPNQFDLMRNGHANLQGAADASFRGLRNTAGGEVYIVRGRNCDFITNSVANAGWDNRELPLIEQFECFNTATSMTVAIAFSEASARDLDADGLANTNEWAIGSDPETADTDGDTMPDGDEVVAGTSPTDPASLFRVSSSRVESQASVVSWSGAVGRLYGLDTATNLLPPASWAPVTNDVPGPGGTISITNPAPDPMRAYRIRVHQP